jgi:hypothetical protein
MTEVIVIFSLAAAGCLVRLSTDLVLHMFARKLPNGTIATGPGEGQSSESQPKADPVVAFGVTLTFYGAIALMLVSALPGSLANQRTCLAFALLCVGGLIGEISRAQTRAAEGEADADSDQPHKAVPSSAGLSVALMLALNMAVAILASGRGLIPIVPPPAVAKSAPTELEQIVVVARRGSGDSGSAPFL